MSQTSKIRVLVVDDSAFARKVLREVLASCPEIEVVGAARDGLEALEKIAELTPDVITLDLVMPGLDGLGVLTALPAQGAPRAVIVSISDAASELTIRALQLGAVELVRKPTALATDQLYELRDELLLKVKAAFVARRTHEAVRTPLQVPPKAPHLPLHEPRILVVGTSTGGPQALTQLLSSLPASFPLPIAVALHIPAGYTDALAKRLDDVCAIEVLEAQPNLPFVPGRAILARGGQHLRFKAAGSATVAELGERQGDTVHAPSVDVLFMSAVDRFGAGVLGAVLTGMGDDGLIGSRAIRAAGGLVLTEAASSCVIYGMPRCVVEAGYSVAQAPIESMGALIMAHL